MRNSAQISEARLIPSVIELAERAGEAIMEVYSKPFKVRQKADQSPVTAADIAADRLINEALANLTPELPVLSEESDCPPFEVRSKWRRYWLVDPLDGTQGFVSRRGEFTVNVALIDNHAPALGVVYLPAQGVCYYACHGDGAFRRQPGEAAQKIRVASRAEAPLRVVTSYSRRNPMTGAFIESLGNVEIERIGSAIKSCRVAEGSADVYPGFSRTLEWDTAAAQCIVERAGGRLMDTRGRPLRYNTRAALNNPKFLVVGDLRRDWASTLSEITAA